MRNPLFGYVMNLREHQLYIQVNRNNPVTSICYMIKKRLHLIWLIRIPKDYPSHKETFFSFRG